MLNSKLALEAYEENGRTLLGESFHNAPYKMVHYGNKNLHEHLEMIIMSASPGMMEGDELEIDIKVKEKAKLRLFTQSFNKLHPMKVKGAYQHTKVKLMEDSILHYIPHPVTPYADAIFKTVNEIDMTENATLIWGDIIASGRVGRGESFQFQSLHSLTKVKVDNKLSVYDNQLLQPEKQRINSLLYYEGYTHQATLIYASPFGDDLKKELDEILAGQYEEITFGFTSCGPNIAMIRAMGNDGELLYDWMATIGRLCWDFTLHKKAEIEDLRAEEETAYINLEEKNQRELPEVPNAAEPDDKPNHRSGPKVKKRDNSKIKASSTA